MKMNNGLQTVKVGLTAPIIIPAGWKVIDSHWVTNGWYVLLENRT